MRYLLILLLSSVVLGVTLWQLRSSDAGPIKNIGAHRLFVIPKEAQPEIRRVEREVDEIEQQALAEWRAPTDGSTPPK
jgi:hypothetical protein